MLLINLKCNWKLIPFHCTLFYLNLKNAIFQSKILENSLHDQKNEGSCSNYLTYLSIFHVKIFFMKCSKNIKLLSEESFFFAYFTIIKLSVVSKMSITRIILSDSYILVDGIGEKESKKKEKMLKSKGAINRVPSILHSVFVVKF